MDDDVLIQRYIEWDTQLDGPERARVAEYGVPVWALIGYLRVVGNDLDQVARDYCVPLDAVRAAVAFYRRHQAVIDARITSNSTPVA